MNRRPNMKGYEYNEAVKKNPAIVKRKIRLSLMDMGGSMYLVNDSDETLKNVKAREWGFSGELSLQNDNDFIYENVLPKEGVLVYGPTTIEDDDYIFRSDFTTGIYIYVESNELGNIRITPKTITKRGFLEQPLIFMDGTFPRSVIVT